MVYKIMKLASTTNSVNYWTPILNSDGTEYSTTDLVVLETKLLELMNTIIKSNLKVYSEFSITDDLTIA